MLALALAVAAATPATAGPVSDCTTALRQGWPTLVEATVTAGTNGNLDADFTRLTELCQDDPTASAQLASLRAGYLVRIGSPEAALLLLDRYPQGPDGPLYVRNLWLRMTAQHELRNQLGYSETREELLEANGRALVASGQWRFVESGSSQAASFRAYQSADGEPAWLFAVSDRRGYEMLTVLARKNPHFSTPEQPSFELVRRTCNIEGGINPGELGTMAAPPYAEVRDRILGYFDGTVARYQNDDGPIFGWPDPNCEISAILPGVGHLIEFDGTEHVDPNAALPSNVVATWLYSQDAAKRARAAAYVTAHPDAVEPFHYAMVISQLLQEGNREQATFWYFVFQIRTWPWRRSAIDQSGYPALYGSLSYALGPETMGWAGSDPAALEALMIRAAHFERTAPLFPDRPEHVTDAEWQSLIAGSRVDHSDEEVRRTFTDKSEIEAQRRANGLYVGPWQEPGAPLPDSWQ